MSADLKNNTRRIYQKVNIEYSQKPSNMLYNTQRTERQDIVVKLSLREDNSVYKAAEETDDIAAIRVKREQNASKTLDYEDIVVSSDEYVALTGVPGSGKTTLIETLLHLWSSNQLWTSKFDFVFVIYLNKLARFKNDHEITCEKMFSHFYPKVKLDVLKKVDDSKSLLILDGFDELYGKQDLENPEEEFTSYTQAIYDLLDFQNRNLPFKRLITSRPTGCNTLLDINKFIKVTGFSRTSIDAYITKHFQQNTDRLAAILEQLKQQQFLYDAMAIPFHCWGICYLINSSVAMEDLGHTYTSLYSNLLVVFILKHGLRKKHHKICDVVRDPKFRDICIGLSELAYKLQQNNKINFTQDDLPAGIDIQLLIADSGMIIEIEDAYGFSKSYQFLHYTFHEFLVAINLFVKGKKGLRGAEEVNKMLAGLSGALADSSNPTSSITKKITEAIAKDKQVTKLEDIVKYCYRTHQLRSCHLFPLIYEYQPSSFHGEFDLELYPIEENVYAKTACKFVLDLCKKGKFSLSKCVLHELDDESTNSNVMVGLDDFLCSFDKLFVIDDKHLGFLVSSVNKLFSCISCHHPFCHQSLDLLLNRTNKLVFVTQLSGDEFVLLMKTLVEKKAGFNDSKFIEIGVANFTETHAYETRELMSHFDRDHVRINDKDFDTFFDELNSKYFNVTIKLLIL